MNYQIVMYDKASKEETFKANFTEDMQGVSWDSLIQGGSGTDMYSIIDISNEPHTIVVQDKEVDETLYSNIRSNIFNYRKDLLQNRPIAKLTGQPISDAMADILERLDGGEYVSMDEIYNLPEILTAESNMEFSTPSIMLKHREFIQEKAINTLLDFGSVLMQQNGKALVDENNDVVYNGVVNKEKRLDIVIGLPASGKSSAITNPVSDEFNMKVIDNDEAKKQIPQYNNGWGACVVHEEAKYIERVVFRKTLQDGDNIIIPKVGGDAQNLIDNYITRAKEYGYTINVHYVELPREKALGRMIRRYIDTGRYLEPKLIDKYVNNVDGNKIEKCYEELKSSGLINGWSKWDNDVAKGESPKLVESFNLEGNYIDNSKNLDDEADVINQIRR